MRTEVCYPLYGHELDEDTTPLQAGLGYFVALGKGDFVGRAALEKIQTHGLTRGLVGFEMKERGIGRDAYEVWVDGKTAGWVTSGGPSPTLNKNIGLCYLPASKAQPGVPIHVIIRNSPVEAVTVATPFYRRAKA